MTYILFLKGFFMEFAMYINPIKLGVLQQYNRHCDRFFKTRTTAGEPSDAPGHKAPHKTINLPGQYWL